MCTSEIHWTPTSKQATVLHVHNPNSKAGWSNVGSTSGRQFWHWTNNPHCCLRNITDIRHTSTKSQQIFPTMNLVGPESLNKLKKKSHSSRNSNTIKRPINPRGVPYTLNIESGHDANVVIEGTEGWGHQWTIELASWLISVFSNQDSNLVITVFAGGQWEQRWLQSRRDF